MSFYEQGWQAPVRQASWEQPPPPSRSGASSASQREESSAFAQQFEEIDKAYDNLQKSGKLFAGNARGPVAPAYGGMQQMGHRPHSGRHSVGDFRTPPPRGGGNQQNYYASQRYQGRPAEADQMAQAKRRMAAQRERELRNYHQEQQYNRSLLAEMASNKSDRSMSPSTLSEEGRRELIARQHRALYGENTPSFGAHGSFNTDSPSSESAPGQQPGPASMRVASPRGVDPFGMGQGEMQQQSETKTTSPSAHQQGQVSTPPSDESSHSRTISKSTTAPVAGAVGPIGSSRPNQQPVGAQNVAKRTTSPLPPSLGFYGQGEQDRSNSQTGNAGAKESNPPSMGVWGTGSGVWGSNKLGASGWS